jgi:hypothetical protein
VLELHDHADAEAQGAAPLEVSGGYVCTAVQGFPLNPWDPFAKTWFSPFDLSTPHHPDGTQDIYCRPVSGTEEGRLLWRVFRLIKYLPVP